MKDLLSILLLVTPLCMLAQKDSILIQEASFKYKVIEPIYEVENVRFLVKTNTSGGYKYNYEMITESVYKKEPSFTYVVKPPIYKIVVKQVKNSKGEKIEINQKIVQTPASFEKIKIIGEFQVLTKYVIKGLIMEHRKPKFDPDIPPTPKEYKYIPIEKLKEPAKLIKVEIPAIYKYID